MTDTTSATTTAGQTIRFEYVPRAGLGRLAIVNFLLGIVTLTIYRFWGKTKVRQHIWSCVHINGQPLEYTGTGKELFKGFLMVLLFFTLPVFGLLTVIQLTLGIDHPSVAILQVAVILLIYLLWGAALYLSRRYQLSRTTWRGIRGTLVGSPIVYSILYFGSLMGRSMSLGWATPVLNVSLQEKMIGEMRFGDLAFKFRGRAGPLYPTYALCWFLTIVAIALLIAGAVFGMVWLTEGVLSSLKDIFESPDGTDEDKKMIVGLTVIGMFVVGYLLVVPMLWAFYSAREMQLFANYTKAGNATFAFNATPGSLIRLIFGNVLLFIFTLGIARPFMQQRVVRYFCDRITVNGTVDVDAISQSMHKYDKSGEGLADAFDLSAI